MALVLSKLVTNSLGQKTMELNQLETVSNSEQPQHIATSHIFLGNSYHLNEWRIRTYVQVSTFFQGNPANGLCLDLG